MTFWGRQVTKHPQTRQTNTILAHRSRSIAVAAAAFIAVLAAATVFWAAGTDGSGAMRDLDIRHVHSIEVNPSNGAILLATHTGLYELEGDGPLAPAGSGYHDLMAFVVIGPNRYLASGHPDLRDTRLRVEDKPPFLGLVESLDAGKSWEPRSLLGEVDFHALVERDGTVWGWDGSTGDLLVTEDLKTWEKLSTVGLNNLVVHPGDEEVLLAATGEGVIRSADGGRTWQPVPAAPRLVLVASGDTEMWGVDTAGNVHRSQDGTTWVGQGQVQGEPQAMGVAGEILYLALAEDGQLVIRRSTDRGSSWEVLYAEVR